VASPKGEKSDLARKVTAPALYAPVEEARGKPAMRWSRDERKRAAVMSSAEQLLSRFGFTVSSEEPLRVRPVGPVLCYAELDTILKRLVAEGVHRRVPQIVFDFGMVQWIEAPWTAVIARLIDFARDSQARCRLAALHGQPAAVIDFFSGNRAVRCLLRPGEPTVPPTQRSEGRASA